jgi:branched-chain amino acid transport system substrate-binding protein
MLLSIKKTTVVLITILSVVLISGCGGQEPIRIGFAAELSGPRAEKGVSARNAVQLAIENINANGGINGRPLELVVKDDKGDPELAKQVDAELVNEKVVAMIAHITSGQVAAVLDQINQDKVVLLSPTGSSAQFSNQADYLFRVIPPTDEQAIGLANYAYNKLSLRQVTGICDLGNKSFSESTWQSFQAEFKKLGGQADECFGFTSGQTDLAPFIEEVMAANPTTIMFASSDIDTALMIQYIRQQSADIPMISASWAQTSELLAKGGGAIEGLHLVALYDLDNPDPKFQEFVQSFEKRYNRTPDFSAAYAYEAALVLAEALKQTDGQAEGLPEALVNIKDLPGVQGSISMNEYGDAKRSFYVAVVENGQYQVIDTVQGNQLGVPQED